jgi:hypothetical protein
MTAYHILGLDDALTEQVRNTMLAPEYGHPVVRETARGTGPCRACLRRFEVGTDERLLFTYRPLAGSRTVGAPGPVFIHAERCTQYTGTSFPPDLHSLPIILEAWAADNRIPHARHVQGSEADAALEDLLADPAVEYVHIRHGVAGCHIARVSRGPLVEQHAPRTVLAATDGSALSSGTG